MEKAIQVLVTTFLSSAKGKDGLDKKSFQKLVSGKLGGLMEDANNKSAVEELTRGLDENNDGKVGFEEYLSLIGYLANSLSQSKSSQSNTSANAS